MNEDKILQELFNRIKENDRTTVPDFMAIHANALSKRKIRRRRRLITGVAAAVLIGLVFTAVLKEHQIAADHSEISSMWESPTSFLLETNTRPIQTYPFFHHSQPVTLSTWQSPTSTLLDPNHLLILN